MDHEERIRSFRGDPPAQRFVRAVVRAMLLSGVAVAGFSTTAVADPITAVFQVTVLTRTDVLQNVTEDFSSSFELTLRFEGISTVSTFPEAKLISRTYEALPPNAPTFSGFPSEIVSTPTSPFAFGQVTESWTGPFDDSTFFRSAFAVRRESGPSSGRSFSQDTILSISRDHVPGPPDLSAGSLFEFLGSGDVDFVHRAIFFDLQDNRVFNHLDFQYSGSARLLRFDLPGDDQRGPTPEPATVVLFGSGLATLLARSRRTRF